MSLKLKDLWQYRELIYFFIWRDITIRYKQTVMGVLWAVLQPGLTMIVFSIFLGRVLRVPSDGIPYPIFVYAGLVPWTFFANGLGQACNSLVGGANLIKKVYFPRLIIPISAVLSGSVNFALAFLMLVLMMLFYGFIPTANVLWLPLFLLLGLCTSLGTSLWLSAMNAQFRDVSYVIPFISQIWLFATPVAYPSSLLSEPWRSLYGLNPMVAVVEGFRWALLGSETAPGPFTAISSVVALVLLTSGAYYFRRTERIFADVV